MMLLFLVLSAAALLVWGKIYEHIWTRGLEARVTFAAGNVYAGDETILTEEIINRKRLALPEIEASFNVPRGVAFRDASNIVVSDHVYKRDIFSLRGMESVKRSYTLACTRRGRYPVSRITLRSWSFLHSRRYELVTEQKEELTVFAGRVDVSKVSRLCDVMLGEEQSRRSLCEDPFAFSGIREYRPEDPMKRINWKASARAGEWMVNTFDTVRADRIMIFLDVSDERIMKEDSLVEYGISAAASLCRQMIRKGQDVALAVNTDPPEVFEPKRGEHQLAAIEYFLTEDLVRRAHTDMAALFARLRESAQDRVCVVISKEPDMEQRLRSESSRAGVTAQSVILVRPWRDGDGEKLDVSGIESRKGGSGL